MSRAVVLASILLVAIATVVVGLARQPRAADPGPSLIDVTVQEGTSMSVGVSPDGRTLAIDLQAVSGRWPWTAVPRGG